MNHFPNKAGAFQTALLADDVEICCLAEQGVLETQAVALVASLRQFGGRFASAHVTVVSPRPSRRPSLATIKALDRLGADYLPLDLRSPVPEYGPSHRVIALAKVERQSRRGVLVQCDSDTLFCAEPDFDLGRAGAAARPVDFKGMCSSGPPDVFEPLWQRLADVARVDLETVPALTPTLGSQPCRANYNAGLFITRRDCELFQVAEGIFLDILRADMRPYATANPVIMSGAGRVSGRGAEFWGTSQIALTMASVRLGLPIALLSDGHNIPVHATDTCVAAPCHLHYHAALRTPEAVAKFRAGRLYPRLSGAFREFLDRALPL